jgi:cell volume regulation protein A
MIKREGEYLKPGGATIILENDTLLVLANNPSDFGVLDQCINKDSINRRESKKIDHP